MALTMTANVKFKPIKKGHKTVFLDQKHLFFLHTKKSRSTDRKGGQPLTKKKKILCFFYFHNQNWDFLKPFWDS